MDFETAKMTATADDEVKPIEGPSQPHLSKQDITKLDLNKITALTPEVVSKSSETCCNGAC